eukprot:5126740-Pyramimonas_sp.AAC.1
MNTIAELFRSADTCKTSRRDRSIRGYRAKHRAGTVRSEDTGGVASRTRWCHKQRAERSVQNKSYIAVCTK